MHMGCILRGKFGQKSKMVTKRYFNMNEVEEYLDLTSDPKYNVRNVSLFPSLPTFFPPHTPPLQCR